MKFATQIGTKHPLGVTLSTTGANFVLFSEHALSVELLVFEDPNQLKPSITLKLDPDKNKSYSFWHIFVEGVKAGMGYAYRVHGPWEPSNGHRFNGNKILIDPYARANTHAIWDRVLATGDVDNLEHSMRSIIVDNPPFDWQGDKPLGIHKRDSIIYELHVGGFTKSVSSGVEHPGTFLGVIEKIDYLKSLGITAVELMPIHEFDETEVLRVLPDGIKLPNYWGYSSVGFFSLHHQYCVSQNPPEAINEFRLMVRELHKVGIEVILDVVFNHTTEGNESGPTINFRGLDNCVYYHLNAKNRSHYDNYSGCGNALNANHPIVSKMIRESLEYWVKEMHVDGFRLDEGSVLSRNQYGSPEVFPRVLWEIELSETLADTKLFTEAWDAAGLYEVGSFPGFRWSEWNGKYRDCVRKFIRGDRGLVGELANRVSGSADLYQRNGEKPINSLNYITCHDGFTLYDLVSFNQKHNQNNGEDNRDGIEENYSYNYGCEGDTDKADIKQKRLTQMKNFFCTLLLSSGVPMFPMGDEIARSQFGNNNAYCQDNNISWFDWNTLKNNQDLWRFVTKLIEYRKKTVVLRREYYSHGKGNDRGLYDLEWSGCQVHKPGWFDKESRVLAVTLGSMTAEDADIHVMFNMEDDGLTFELPKLVNRSWYRVICTHMPSPEDFLTVPQKLSNQQDINIHGKSIVVIQSQ